MIRVRRRDRGREVGGHPAGGVRRVSWRRSGLRFPAACLALLAAGALAGPAGAPCAVPGAAALAAQSTHVLVVSGLGGAPEYSRRFGQWGAELVSAVIAAGVPPGNVAWLAEGESVDEAVTGVARRDAVAAALAALAERSSAGDVVLVVLFGHGSARGDEVRLNLPGPDLTAGDLAALLEPLASRRVVVVNAASASGGFVEPLSGQGRVVITATRSVREDEATRFGGHFVAALAGDVADTDKDGRVSMLEAFEFARAEVARSYSEAGHLPTEHPLLDDNGDGRGSLEPGDEDGTLAAAIALAPASGAGEAGAADPALRSLRAEQARLQSELAALRARQDSMEPAAYRAALESLLLEIARNGRAIREAEAAGDATPDSGSAAPPPDPGEAQP